MNIDQFFLLASAIAAVGWILLIFISPFWQSYDRVVIGVVVVILALAYTILNATNFPPHIVQKFSTLNGVMDLFSTKPVVMAAWCHIMAFDLIAAVWMKKNSVRHGIGHWIIIPAFIFTCMLGPFGFLIYVGTRWGKTGKYFAEN